MKNHADAMIFHTAICEKNFQFFGALTELQSEHSSLWMADEKSYSRISRRRRRANAPEWRLEWK